MCLITKIKFLNFFLKALDEAHSNIEFTVVRGFQSCLAFLILFLSARNDLCSVVTENVPAYKSIFKIPYVGSISNEFNKNVSNLIK